MPNRTPSFVLSFLAVGLIASRAAADPPSADSATASAPATAIAPAPAPAPPAPTATKPVWPTALLASAGALSFGLGIGLDVVGAEQLLPEGRLTCAPGMSPCPRPLDKDVAAYNRYEDAGLACFIIGGAAFAGMVSYVIWPGAKPSSPPKTSVVRGEVHPIVGPGVIGLAGGGSF